MSRADEPSDSNEAGESNGRASAMSKGPAPPLTIDVGAIASDAVAQARPDLVTRPTGRAVRAAIEVRISRIARSPSVSLLDFTRVRILDFSCADEVVAKLLVRYMRRDRPREAFFLFRAVGDIHRHAVEEVLGRHGLAAVCDLGGGYELLGSATEEERTAWRTLEHRGRVSLSELAAEFGEQGVPVIRGLADRRVAWCGRRGDARALSEIARNP
ncbi:MAG: hypothetical protein F4237_03165 [Gemmatimonadetes bacterium]|nr:hypothetical protein [Gemmatimonadota bacterium]